MNFLLVLVALILAFVPYVNTTIVILFSFSERNLKTVFYAILFLVLSIVFMRLNDKTEADYLKDFYKVAHIENLEFFNDKEELSFLLREYSLIKTEMPDGYHEKKVKKKSVTEVHRIKVEYGEYTSYLITDLKGNLITNYLDKLHDLQLANYKKDNPAKKIIIGERITTVSIYWYLMKLMFLLSIINTFYVYFSGSDVAFNNNEKIRLNNKRNSEITAGETIIEKGVEELNTLEKHTSNSSGNDEVLITASSIKIAINSAKENDFASLDGISIIQAKYLIKERKDNGNYKSITDFFSRNAISERLQKKLKPHLNIADFNEDFEDNNKGRILEF